MTDQQAGIFLKAIYHYQLHGELPKLDFSIEMAITPFINQFKRDNEKYIGISEKRKELGSLGGKQKVANASKSKQSVAKLADNDSDSDSDNVKEKKKTNIFSFKKSLLELLHDEQLTNDFLEVRKNKKLTNTQTALKGLVKQIELTGRQPQEIINLCVEKSWGGFEKKWLDNIAIAETPKITTKEESKQREIEKFRKLGWSEENIKLVTENNVW